MESFFARKYSLFCLLLALLPAAPFAQAFRMTEFDLDSSIRQNTDGSAYTGAVLKTGGEFSAAGRVNFVFGLEFDTDNLLYIFRGNPETRRPADAFVTRMALEFPVQAGGQHILPAVFLGEYADLSSGDLLLRTLRTRLEKPDFLRSRPFSLFSDETTTTGIGAGAVWRAALLPVTAGGWISWNQEIAAPGFRFHAQTAGAVPGLIWNVFAVFGAGSGEEAESGEQDFTLSAGFSVHAGAENRLSLYMQGKVQPLSLRSPGGIPDRISERLHFLFEPRYTGSLVQMAAAFFLSPVMQPYSVPWLDPAEDSQYAGMNIRFALGNEWENGQSIGVNFTLLSALNGTEVRTEDTAYCLGPFFRFTAGGMLFTLGTTLNLSRISSPLSAGEINLHVEAAL